MAGPPSQQDIFDVRKIRRLVELMKEHDLNEIDLRQENMRIQLRRGANPAVSPLIAPPAPMATPAPAPVPRPATAESPAPETAASGQPSGTVALIKSPIVGTFYSAPDPDAPAFIKVGDHVGPETTVCIVEAMKVFNEIPAEISGKITAVLVENGSPVEFGQPLFRVDTAA